LISASLQVGYSGPGAAQVGLHNVERYFGSEKS